MGAIQAAFDAANTISKHFMIGEFLTIAGQFYFRINIPPSQACPGKISYKFQPVLTVTVKFPQAETNDFGRTGLFNHPKRTALDS